MRIGCGIDIHNSKKTKDIPPTQDAPQTPRRTARARKPNLTIFLQKSYVNFCILSIIRVILHPVFRYHSFWPKT
jgi:hypothetical protein